MVDLTRLLTLLCFLFWLPFVLLFALILATCVRALWRSLRSKITLDTLHRRA